MSKAFVSKALVSKAFVVGALAMFAALTPAFAAFAPNRIVTAVDYEAKTFSCQAKAGEPSTTYKTTSKTRIRVSGKRARLSYLWDRGNFSEIKVGDIIAVQYRLQGNDSVADRVAVYPRK